MLPANSKPGHLARHFMEPEGNGNSLLTRHNPVTANLNVQCGLRRHF
jgi:hypothetical protein